MWDSCHDGLGSWWEEWRERRTSWVSVDPGPPRRMTEGGLCLSSAHDAPVHLAGSLFLVHPRKRGPGAASSNLLCW